MSSKIIKRSALLLVVFVLYTIVSISEAADYSVHVIVPNEKVYSAAFFKKSNFTSGAYYIEGYVVKIYTCPECPKGTLCKPCMQDNIVISENSKIIDNYLGVGKTEIIVFVKDHKVFQLGKKYRFLVKVLDYKSTLEPINDLELASYNKL